MKTSTNETIAALATSNLVIEGQCAHSPAPDDHRQFLCSHCRNLVVICSYCDRGQSCCSPACSRARRLLLQRQNNKHYQHSPRGARRHAQRQDRYRKRCRAAAANPPQKSSVRGAGWFVAMAHPHYGVIGVGQGLSRSLKQLSRPF